MINLRRRIQVWVAILAALSLLVLLLDQYQLLRYDIKGIQFRDSHSAAPTQPQTPSVGVNMTVSLFAEYIENAQNQLRLQLNRYNEQVSIISKSNDPAAHIRLNNKLADTALSDFMRFSQSLVNEFQWRIRNLSTVACEVPQAEELHEKMVDIVQAAVLTERKKAVQECQTYILANQEKNQKELEFSKATLEKHYDNLHRMKCVEEVAQCVDSHELCFPGMEDSLERYYINHEHALHGSRRFDKDKTYFLENREKDKPLLERIVQLTDEINITLSTEPQDPRPRPAGSLQPEQILLLCGSTDNVDDDHYKEFTSKIIENHQAYADHWGYKQKFTNFTRFSTENVEHPVWYKLPAIQEQFALHPEVEWIWWLDADSMIMNGNVDLIDTLLGPEGLESKIIHGRPVSTVESIFNQGSTVPLKDEMKAEDISFIFAHDWLSLNAGSFFIKRSSLSELLLQVWGDPLMIRDVDGFSTFERREQDVFVHLYLNHQAVRQATAVVPQRLINAFTNGGNWGEDHLMKWEDGDFVLHFAGLRGEDLLQNFKYYRERVVIPGGGLYADRHVAEFEESQNIDRVESKPEDNYAIKFSDLMGDDFDGKVRDPEYGHPDALKNKAQDNAHQKSDDGYDSSGDTKDSTADSKVSGEQALRESDSRQSQKESQESNEFDGSRDSKRNTPHP